MFYDGKGNRWAASPRGLQIRQHRANGLPPVTQRELLLSRRLAERAPKSRAVEQRVIAEAAGAARLVENHTFHRAVKNPHHAPALHQRDGADEARVPEIGRSSCR